VVYESDTESRIPSLVFACRQFNSYAGKVE